MRKQKISSPSAKEKEIGSKKREIGTSKVIQNYLLHLEGRPIEQALMIKDLLDRGWTQQEIGKHVGWSQSKISVRLKLLDLHPELQERAKRGDIPPTIAWKLANMPLEKQKEYIAKEKILLKEVEKEKRNIALSEEVKALLDEEIPGFESQEEKKTKCPRCGHVYVLS